MEVVSNSSPLIHLTKIGRLNLLHELYDKVHVPEQVYLECTDTVQYREEVNSISQSAWINTHSIENRRLFRLLHSEIDAGEAAALVLALELNVDLISVQKISPKNG